VGTGQILTDDRRIREVLIRAHTIALLGLSPKPGRDSYQVAAYLKDHGYRIIPVRPAQTEILGEKAYPSLNDLPGTVDIIDVFRSPEQIPPHAREALRLRPLVFWMQAGIANPAAAGLLTAAGIDVVMDRCIKHEHERLFGNVTL
jgi:predicted CoA-binding protein